MNQYKKAMDAILAKATQLSSIASSDTTTPAKDAEMEQRLRAEGFVSYVTPQKQEIWVPCPVAPTSKIQDYQKGFSSMSPETIKEVYPCLKYVEKNFFPIIDELHAGVESGETSMQFVQEAIIKLIIEGTEEAIDKTGGMEAQGNSAVAKASSNAEAIAIYSKNKDAVEKLLGGGDVE